MLGWVARGRLCYELAVGIDCAVTSRKIRCVTRIPDLLPRPLRVPRLGEQEPRLDRISYLFTHDFGLVPLAGVANGRRAGEVDGRRSGLLNKGRLRDDWCNHPQG